MCMCACARTFVCVFVYVCMPCMPVFMHISGVMCYCVTAYLHTSWRVCVSVFSGQSIHVASILWKICAAVVRE